MEDESLALIMDDPVRFQIYFELYFEQKMTASDLLEKLPINRSTLSYHLTKLVEADFIDVEVPPTGRQIKSYRLKYRNYMKHRIFENTSNELNKEERQKFLKRAVINYAFDLRFASVMLNELSSKITIDENIEDIEFSKTKYSFKRNEIDEFILNNEVVYLSKNQVKKLEKEISSLVTKLKEEEEKETEILVEKGNNPAYVGILGFFPVVAKPFFTEERITKNLERIEDDEENYETNNN